MTFFFEIQTISFSKTCLFSVKILAIFQASMSLSRTNCHTLISVLSFMQSFECTNMSNFDTHSCGIHLFIYSHIYQFVLKTRFIEVLFCVDSGNLDSGLRALMIVSRLCYIAILKHVLLSVHYSDVDMNICVSME